MKSKRSLSEIAAGALAAEAREAPEQSLEARARTIEAMARAMRDRKRRELLRGRILAAFAIAASLTIAVGINLTGRDTSRATKPASTEKVVTPSAIASFVRGSPAVVRQGSRHVLSDGAAFEPGDRVVVDPGSRMTIAFTGGTYVVVDEGADVRLMSAAPSTIFELDSGAIRADVAKRAPNERFIIRTIDAEIEVHGTSFEVSRVGSDPACGNGTTTRVKVREGIVSVRAGGDRGVRSSERDLAQGLCRSSVACGRGELIPHDVESGPTGHTPHVEPRRAERPLRARRRAETRGRRDRRDRHVR